MIKLQINTIEADQSALRITSKKDDFAELVVLIQRELIGMNLVETVKLAEQHGLPKMTIEEINTEVQAVQRLNKP